MPDRELTDRELLVIFHDKSADLSLLNEGEQKRLLTLTDFSGKGPERDSAASRFLSNAGEVLNPVAMVKGLANAAIHPIDTAGNIIRAQVDQGRQAVDRFQQGRYSEALGHGAAAVLPVLGPAAAEAGEQIRTGDVAGGFGRGAGLVASAFVPEAVRRLPSRAARVAPAGADVDAVRFAASRDIPMSVGQVTGNPVARGVEQLNERTSIGGSLVGKAKRDSQAAALSRVGDELAGKVNPSPVAPEQAGQAMRDAVSKAAADFSADADTAYTRLRTLEQQQAQTIAKTGGVRGPSTSAKPFTNVPLAVDIAPTKAAMQPVYEALLRKKELVGTLMGDEARALTRLDAIMQAPDMAPLSVADSALGDIKALSRVDQAFRRTSGQGIAAEAVKNLETAVRATARQGGPNVFNALMDGRAATVNKYKAIEALDKLRAEPVQAFQQATYAKDAGVSTLRDVAKYAPDAMPQIGRAFLDDILSTATAEGGFGKTQSILTKWQNLGPQTKRLLFKDPALIKELDNFFLFAKRAGENANPSGSAFVGTLSAKGMFTLMNPWTGVPMEVGQTALASAMWNPRVVRLLNRSLTTPVRATGSARNVVGELARAGVLAEQSTQPQPGEVYLTMRGPSSSPTN